MEESDSKKIANNQAPKFSSPSRRGRGEVGLRPSREGGVRSNSYCGKKARARSSPAPKGEGARGRGIQRAKKRPPVRTAFLNFTGSHQSISMTRNFEFTQKDLMSRI